MNSRERWLACMRFQPVDHVPDQEFGYWAETFPVWHEQGLPEYVNSIPRADIFFGFETVMMAPGNTGPIPGFEYKVLSEDDRTLTILDWDGATKMVAKDGHSTIPRYLKFPIETREDWNEFKKRLDPTDSRRYLPEDQWQEWKKAAAASEVPVAVHSGSLFGRLRDWMGFENIAIACMDDPEWIEEMIEYMTEFQLATIKRAVEEVQIDLCHFWEDMAFNHGPIISPAMFRKWLTPRYKRITDFLHAHGCEFAIVDCDGNINCVVDGWLDGGVNIMFPLEIRGRTDPKWMREQFGRRVLLAGGVDKTQLAGTREMIDREIERITPLVEQGGYIPHVDHRCPPDVSYDNYLYYLKRKREAFGIPEPAPWEERKAAYDWAK
jgi:uroporphyrinogen-III decarboxylase